MKCSTAVDWFKTENVDADAEIRKAEKRKDFHFCSNSAKKQYHL